MTKYLVCVFTIAVLLGGVTSNLLTCGLMQMAPITPDNFILKRPGIVCQDTEEKFRLARSGLRNCLGFDIDIERLESLYQEFCYPNSDFRQKAERQRECLSSHLTESLRCVSIMQKSKDLIDALDPTNSINIICQRYAAEMISCLRENVGGPCGKEGKEVYGRIAEVAEPLIKGPCLSAARFGIDGGVPSDDFENKFVYSSTGDSNPFSTYSSTGDSNPFSTYSSTVDRNPFSVYTSTVESDSYAASAVTVHSFTYYLLIGLIFFVNW